MMSRDAEAKWTPEPWSIREHPSGDGDFYVSGPMTADHPYSTHPRRLDSIEIMSDEDYPRKRMDGDRIVACVNALAGIEDTAAFVAANQRLQQRVDELEEASRDVLKSVENYFCQRKPESEWDEYDHMMAPYWERFRDLLSPKEQPK
jgi:hypothetical protein